MENEVPNKTTNNTKLFFITVFLFLLNYAANVEEAYYKTDTKELSYIYLSITKQEPYLMG